MAAKTTGFDLIEVVFLGLKIDKYTLLQQLYFLPLIQYLLQFSTYKNLTYVYQILANVMEIPQNQTVY